MARYWRLMGEYDAESATFTAFAGGGGASPYTPETDGTLVAVRVLPASTAATTLFEMVNIRLTCTLWKPNAIEVGAIGNGLRTVPATPQKEFDWLINQPVRTNVNITMEGENLAGTPVTVQVFVYGLFEC